ncbi:hypothetical protein LSAT2_026138 [Lamellibrachia satsuma]|nr:hypothetical protein LSAT2_026138 [Lamellibrachia satsuma]
MEVSVTEPEKRTGTSSVAMQDTYTVYLVETKVTDREMPGYGDPPEVLSGALPSEFELLRTYLEVMYPATTYCATLCREASMSRGTTMELLLPPLPEKGQSSHD